MPGWSVVVPVKRLELAKTRLRPAVSPARHAALVLAICLDTVTAARACPAVARVIAVTDDRQATEALRALGITIVPDEPDRGLNPALEHGAAVAVAAAPEAPVAVLSSDLPALRPAELAQALTAAAGHQRAFVSDASGEGTTLLAAATGQALSPAYGLHSRTAHAASGARELAGDWPSLRRDVDTAADLAVAAALGLGTHTAALLGR